MNNAILRLLLTALILTAGHRLDAQVLDVNQFKVTVYRQTSSAPPVAPDVPNGWYFGTYIDTDPAAGVTNVTVYSPGNGVLPLNQFSPTYFEASTPYYANETLFDADYPGGTNYDYNYEFTDGTASTYIEDELFNISTTNLYATSIPAFTPACWTAMQTVDPAQPFTLTWNAYTLTPGADLAYTFISINDHATGNGVIAPSGPPEITSTNLPAYSLQYGRVYDVSLFFSERQTPPDYGLSDASIIAGWDNLTLTTLQTLPLWLQIAPAGTNVLLTWPAAATNYQLQATASLSAGGLWQAVTNPPIVSGATNWLTLPARAASTFFRLSTF
jgi:hypothetical protein